jgi:hypothetical protein
MKLEELYQNYNDLNQDDRLAFIASYRHKRAVDLTHTETPTAKKQGLLVLSEEEKVLMKLLGIKQKDIKAFRALKDEAPEVTAEEESTPEEDAVLFDDDNLTLEAEE